MLQKNICVVLLVGLLSSLSLSALAAPNQIILIRHAEKPAQGNEVNPAGCQRSYALLNFFEKDPTVNQFGKPAAIYAQGAKDHGPGKPPGSLRPIQTISPTAQDLQLKVQTQFMRDDYAGVVGDIKQQYDGKTVIMSWEHNAIPGLAQAFGAQLNVNAQSWPSTVFDEAWVLKLDPKTQNYSLDKIIPEYVLKGDNPKGSDSKDGFLNWKGPVAPGSGPAFEGDPKLCTDNNKGLNEIVAKVAKPVPAGIVGVTPAGQKEPISSKAME